jgi:hypothetical protein
MQCFLGLGLFRSQTARQRSPAENSFPFLQPRPRETQAGKVLLRALGVVSGFEQKILERIALRKGFSFTHGTR